MIGRIGMGQVLGAMWILGAFGLFFALALDVLTGQVPFEVVPVVALELAIPVFVGFRLIRRPTARLARWSAVLAAVASFAAVMFAADASVSKSSSPLPAPILVGCLALLALSIVASIRYRAPRVRPAD
jgi:hypothetical protein